MSVEQLSSSLRDAGLRVTAPRLATLQVVAHTPHADADAVWLGVRDRLGSVSRQAVYDVLHALTDAQLLRRVHLDGRSARYEIDHHDNHHHMICRICGDLQDIPCTKGEAPCLEPDVDHGYELEVADVVYRGVCTSCQSLQATA